MKTFITIAILAVFAAATPVELVAKDAIPQQCTTDCCSTEVNICDYVHCGGGIFTC
ncbi:predicted protein [Plenodomus lingam JN3]|uniref:Predicted protein n=1 Tax=Leptosphaeria maculans (strain JN3 / isolate v23.1.3 / race Av1-4-5-6-7-8) TaxID=985895 RepID=E5A4C1_LEPMJ|nr:predicted protein [Plenodomus lingam JN3]CBX98466.1 predicted protein [Plenodomus lingam JN3]